MTAPRSRREPRRGRRRGRWLRAFGLGVALPGAVVLAGVFLSVYVDLTQTFESRRGSAPSRIWSDRLELEAGMTLDATALAARLDREGYARVPGDPGGPGEYSRSPTRIDAHLRRFSAGSLRLPPRRVRIEFAAGSIRSLEDGTRRPLRSAIVEPELLARVYGARHEERIVLPLSEIPPGFVHAVLAAEDARFFAHPGFDPLAIARAAWANLRSGQVVQGGSTITQQTVKNLYLGNERTFRRKLRELVMSVLLEIRYPKERILEVYLNEVYLGQRGPVAICGAGAGARHVFGKDLADLGPGEWAALAGMIRNPGGYDPGQHPGRTRARRDQVLDAMVEHGWLAKERAAEEKRSDLRRAGGTPSSGIALHAVDWVRSLVRTDARGGGLGVAGIDVLTTLDTTLQTAAEAALRRGLESLDRRVSRGRGGPRTLEGAVVALDPRTGEVLALVGGRDYRTSQFNRAVQARRQPGSCIKPFVVLAALEAAADGRPGGVTAATLVEDEPVEIVAGGSSWRPRNYDGSFRGPVPVRAALEESLNVPVVRISQAVGTAAVAEAAARCGLPADLRPLPSLALGAQEVTPLALAEAYATIAAGGVRRPLRVVREIAPGGGEIAPAASPRRAVRPDVAYVLTDLLRGVLDRGTAASARGLGFSREAAGKTGTTDDTRDAWFVGYTPDLVVLVWVGYDDGSRTGLTGASGALPIWVEVLRGAAHRLRAVGFAEPPGVVHAVVDPESGGLAGSGCPERREEVFVAGTEPGEACALHERGFLRWLRRLFRRDEDRVD